MSLFVISVIVVLCTLVRGFISYVCEKGCLHGVFLVIVCTEDGLNVTENVLFFFHSLAVLCTFCLFTS